MPRKKKILYKKRVYLFIPKNRELSIHETHLLIKTFNHLFQLSADNAASLLNSNFLKAKIDMKFPKRSAHSSYQASNSLSAVEKLLNSEKISLTIDENTITEKASNKDKNFKMVKLLVEVDTILFPPWFKRNQGFIKSLGQFISIDRKSEETAYALLMSAIQNVSPQEEKALLEPTLSCFKRQFGKPELKRTAKANPVKAKLMIINNKDTDRDGDPLLASIYLLIQPNQSIKYIPFKLKKPTKSHSIHDLINDPDTTYSVYATTNQNQIFIELVLTAKQQVTYQASIEESQGVRNPFTGTRTFKQRTLWNDKHKDGKFTIINDNKLSDCTIAFSAPNGGYDKSSIESALTEINNVLSLKEFYGNIKPKMFTGHSGTPKTKPLLLN
ncbi:hypothetical protein [Vibrio rotiferianus]|uniref:hypothetical protein n=1 Tax=Vibrio rotiferianus TaxID=190895 RepID=UPI002492F801|nr:hypothetical protein [Vibrio rotiferianus]